MRELLLPRTDAGVLVQAVAAAIVFVLVFVVVRRDQDLRLLVLGLAVLTAAWFTLRSLH